MSSQLEDMLIEKIADPISSHINQDGVKGNPGKINTELVSVMISAPLVSAKMWWFSHQHSIPEEEMLEQLNLVIDSFI